MFNNLKSDAVRNSQEKHKETIEKLKSRDSVTMAFKEKPFAEVKHKKTL